ncbi:hypothetical protein QBC36DRAFT_35400 [Triangularia setosa]|uniref:Uncharacterized protein n=1 Tax=Triangularia setosa TaxID=2587417 RepID=A0AAN6W3J5_9PEZI|nr:hypothetical protein QBC36DRAFT_35400 [Podospora setosa]
MTTTTTTTRHIECFLYFTNPNHHTHKLHSATGHLFFFFFLAFFNSSIYFTQHNTTLYCSSAFSLTGSVRLGKKQISYNLIKLNIVIHTHTNTLVVVVFFLS